ncbi:hypothetical protein [Sinorhizobium medicae]|uniref:hypothetical protein n=1 Tax=Sinorhizobium medicae TaxID=110321 RepID=UPI002AF6ACEF|nr:hypothetical protein [Sinorhizobium medicae]WQO59440.1 hypothetical protein U8C35_02980 [Sinorhizobium medicae]
MNRIQRHSETAAAKIAAAPRCVRSLEERLADDMRELAFSGQDVSVEMLKCRGWSEPTLKRLLPEAAKIARRQSVRQVA